MPRQQEIILADGQPEKLELLIDLLGTVREWIEHRIEPKRRSTEAADPGKAVQAPQADA